MLFIHYIVGSNRTGNEVAVAIGISGDPAVALNQLNAWSPFALKLLGAEAGTPEKLEAVRTRFKATQLNGPWFKMTPELKAHVESLSAIDTTKASATKRVSVDLEPEEFADLEVFVDELGAKSKADLFRRALRFYRALHRYKAQGHLIQAIKGGRLVQFPDLDDVRGP